MRIETALIFSVAIVIVTLIICVTYYNVTLVKIGYASNSTHSYSYGPPAERH